MSENASGRRTLVYLIPFLLFAILGGFLAARLLAPGDDATFSVGEAQPLDLPLLYGEGKLTNETLKAANGPVIVNFWFSRCPPCHLEHPQLMALAESGAAPIIGVAYRDPPNDSKAFLAEKGNPFTHVGVDADGFAAISWGVSLFPETFVLNASGEVIYRHSGAITPDDLETRILPAIEKARGG